VARLLPDSTEAMPAGCSRSGCLQGALGTDLAVGPRPAQGPPGICGRGTDEDDPGEQTTTAHIGPAHGAVDRLWRGDPPGCGKPPAPARSGEDRAPVLSHVMDTIRAAGTRRKNRRRALRDAPEEPGVRRGETGWRRSGRHRLNADGSESFGRLAAPATTRPCWPSDSGTSHAVPRGRPAHDPARVRGRDRAAVVVMAHRSPTRPQAGFGRAAWDVHRRNGPPGAHRSPCAWIGIARERVRDGT